MVTKTDSKKSAPCIKIPITAGNLRNGHVYLREFLWFFPKEAMRPQRTSGSDLSPCILDLPGVGTVESEIDPTKAIFRWRGWKKFFRLHRVAEGDQLVFSRTNRKRFSVGVEHNVLEGLSLSEELSKQVGHVTPETRSRKRCNDLSGEEWLRYSLSLWSDIRKTAQEIALGHPAMFPTQLCERLMMMFLRRRGKHHILDPFMGSGSTLVAARTLGKVGIGLEINADYIEMARKRLDAPSLFDQHAPEYAIHRADARRILDHVQPNSIDLCVTSPPYWDILSQKRTADSKDIRDYGNMPEDLGTIRDYEEFLEQLGSIFGDVLRVLRASAYCIVVVMDLRKKNRFFPLHSDLATMLCQKGFVFDDTIIWDRRSEYNNLRPLGYPAVFRVNKVHEFILIFRKPAQ